MEKGKLNRNRSEAVISHKVSNASVLAARLLCVSIAPFALPVVPDVYMIKSGASPSKFVIGRAEDIADANAIRSSIFQSRAGTRRSSDATIAFGSTSKRM